jgi:hypothetical protein
MRAQFDLILDSLENSWFQVAALLPRLLAAILLLIVGWLLARLVQRVAVRLMRLVRLDTAAEHAGVDDFLVRGGVRLTVVSLVGQILYWGLILIFAVAVFNVLGLTVAPDLVERISAYLPNVVAALVVVVFGSIGARFIRGLVVAYLSNVGVKDGERIGLLLQAVLLAFVGLLALEQLGIAVTILASAFELAFGGFCLALALAFGLGGRSWAESVLERTRSKR